MKRTHLPLNALRVFDAAARHLSFTRAADELAVTPPPWASRSARWKTCWAWCCFAAPPRGWN
jgi:hypothetical protein